MSSQLRLSRAYIVLLLLAPTMLGSHSVETSGSQLSLSVNPSTVVIKVGDNATVGLTLTTDEVLRQVCFGEEGFPSSGFIVIFLPQCAVTQNGPTSTELIVGVTPAAAPQNFTALIQAMIGNQTASAPLTVTVIPAISPWVPWLGIFLFFLVIGAALFVRPHKPKVKGKGKKSD